MKKSVSAPRPPRHLARIVFFSCLLTFVGSRVLVILIMTRRMPDLFLHAGGTHVHHLNYGIFLLSLVGGLLLFGDFGERAIAWIAVAYGVGMALTFDEFGMWLHLGGGYWQRASFDAVIVVLSVLGLAAFAPRWERLGPRHYWAAGLTVLLVGFFTWFSFEGAKYVDKRLGTRLQEMEEGGPQ